jgi:hypothetical protein
MCYDEPTVCSGSVGELRGAALNGRQTTEGGTRCRLPQPQHENQNGGRLHNKKNNRKMMKIFRGHQLQQREHRQKDHPVSISSSWMKV